MKWIIFCKVVVASLIFACAAQGQSSSPNEVPSKIAKGAKFPSVAQVFGKVYNTRNPGKPVLIKNHEVLHEKALIETDKNSKVRIDLDNFASLIVFENSKVQIPVITWGEGEILDIHLLAGKLRYNCEKDCVRTIHTDLSREVFTNGEYLLEYRPESPFVELTVLHGILDFGGLEAEDSITVDAGKKVVFQGLKENNEVAYDVLLKGRKVARGKLQPVVVIKPEDLKKLDEETAIKKIVVIPEAKRRAKRTEKQICDQPFGELNQCAWVCEGKLRRLKKCDLSKPGIRCVRRRCNANGQWEDPLELTDLVNRCELAPVVGPCDY